MQNVSTKIYLYRDFAAGVYLSEAPSLLGFCLVSNTTQHHRPPLPTWGEGGGGELERRLVVQEFTKLGIKYQHDWLYLQSIKSNEHLQQSPFTGQFFFDDDIWFWCP